MKPVLLSLTALALASCQSYPPQYRYGPEPTEIRVIDGTSEAGAEVARVWLRCLGFWDSDQGERALLMVARIENRSDFDLASVEEDLVALTGDLLAFDPARFDPSPPATIPPGGEGRLDLVFALPADWVETRLDADFDTLSLSWGLRGDGREFRVHSSFVRIDPRSLPYNAPYYTSRVSVGMGWTF